MRRSRLEAQILLTPLMDTAWTLLIIFIITAPIVFRGIDVRLPSSETTTISPEDMKPVTVTLTRDRTIFFNEEKVDMRGLEKRLKERVRQNPALSIHLRADADVPHGVVVRIMDVARKNGVEYLGIITQPLERME